MKEEPDAPDVLKSKSMIAERKEDSFVLYSLCAMSLREPWTCRQCLSIQHYTESLFLIG